MKKFMLCIVLVIMVVCFQSSFAAFDQKTVLGHHGEKYITINPDLYNIDYVEYDTIKVTCEKTNKSYTFTLCKDAYQLVGDYYYNSEIIEDIN